MEPEQPLTPETVITPTAPDAQVDEPPAAQPTIPPVQDASPAPATEMPTPTPTPTPTPPPAAATKAKAEPSAAVSAKTRVPNTLPVDEPGERTVCVVKRHPIGTMTVYAMCALAVLVTAALAFGLAPALVSGSQVTLIGALVFVIVLAVCAAYALIYSKVYWGNSWTVTSDSLTQVRQFSLFNRQSSQLSLKDLEDVTVEQNGILPDMFNYGVLRVETAGESSKFLFPFCPNPNYYAQQILAAREAFERNRIAEEESPSQQTPTP
ncbi:MAG TPA: PH domain-containing protein [Candidatus Saccharimonadales bacterium]|nr:PH domain-containing protein [Candidatus Saccharimonadales bacterium]